MNPPVILIIFYVVFTDTFVLNLKQICFYLVSVQDHHLILKSYTCSIIVFEMWSFTISILIEGSISVQSNNCALLFWRGILCLSDHCNNTVGMFIILISFALVWSMQFAVESFARLVHNYVIIILSCILKKANEAVF
jgi:hypothetical protein